MRVAKAASIDDLRRNAGGEALHAFMLSRASRPSPLGSPGRDVHHRGHGVADHPVAAARLKRQLRLPDRAFRFLEYHGENDTSHLDRWLQAVTFALERDPTLVPRRSSKPRGSRRASTCSRWRKSCEGARPTSIAAPTIRTTRTRGWRSTWTRARRSRTRQAPVAPERQVAVSRQFVLLFVRPRRPSPRGAHPGDEDGDAAAPGRLRAAPQDPPAGAHDVRQPQREPAHPAPFPHRLGGARLRRPERRRRGAAVDPR